MQRFNARARQSFSLAESDEAVPVVPVQPVLRAHPKEPGAVLQDHLDSQILEPFLFAVDLEVIPLGVERGGPDQSGYYYAAQGVVLTTYIRPFLLISLG
jgi:hypothetical protein